MKPLILAILPVAFLATPAAAEMEISVYTGVQSAPHSTIEGNDPGGVGVFDYNAGWDGKSFDMPPYYGFRATWWRTERVGFALEFNHAKVYADDETLADTGFSRLEFTDGLNIVTLNAFYRWPSESRRWTPYVGAGAGVAIPHVDIQSAGGKTFEYQLTGPALQLVAGASYDLNDKWAVFGEYKGTYTQNEADLDSGGTLETDLITNALNIGLTFRF
ncbi:MAG: outer membrane beta-barrel protein [Pseudomonadota bacterium]|jgi:lipid A oxidase|nr:outer membrane beta-barrel protein [Pseudomonadota bacterium]